jgi:hypothetical protein
MLAARCVWLVACILLARRALAGGVLVCVAWRLCHGEHCSLMCAAWCSWLSGLVSVCWQCAGVRVMVSIRCVTCAWCSWLSGLVSVCWQCAGVRVMVSIRCVTCLAWCLCLVGWAGTCWWRAGVRCLVLAYRRMLLIACRCLLVDACVLLGAAVRTVVGAGYAALAVARASVAVV